MEFCKDDVEKLKQIFAASKIGGIETVVISDGMVRGANEQKDVAIISESHLSIDPTIKIGLARMQEFEKRLQLFSGDIKIDCKLNDANDVSMMTITGGKSKAQFRCTQERLIRYPKMNDDQPAVVITMTKAEGQHVSKAAKTFKSDLTTVHISRTGVVTIECSDATNDKFSVELSEQAEYVTDSESYVFSYVGQRFSDVIDALAKDDDKISFVIGEGGSATTVVKGHTLIIMSITDGE